MTEARRSVRVGVLGTGAISQIVHMPILSTREDVEILAVSDQDIHKAGMIAERYGVPETLSEDEILERPDLDAVFVCTPNHVHEAQALAALEHGKHVLVERPLALTPEGVGRLVAAAEKADRYLVVGMSHRHRPDVAALRAFVASGELGDIYSMRGAWLNRKTPLPKAMWRQRPDEAGGGALMDLGVQTLDMCLWVVGYPPILRVKAVTHTEAYDVEDAANVMAELEGGVVLTVEVSWGHFGGEDHHYLRVTGTEGSGSLPPLEIYKQLGGRPLEVTPRQPLPKGRENPYTNAYRREIDEFIRTVSGQGSVEPPLEQARLMGLIQAAYRSAREGREVEL